MGSAAHYNVQYLCVDDNIEANFIFLQVTTFDIIVFVLPFVPHHRSIGICRSSMIHGDSLMIFIEARR